MEVVRDARASLQATRWQRPVAGPGAATPGHGRSNSAGPRLVLEPLAAGTTLSHGCRHGVSSPPGRPQGASSARRPSSGPGPAVPRLDCTQVHSAAPDLALQRRETAEKPPAGRGRPACPAPRPPAAAKSAATSAVDDEEAQLLQELSQLDEKLTEKESTLQGIMERGATLRAEFAASQDEARLLSAEVAQLDSILQTPTAEPTVTDGLIGERQRARLAMGLSEA
mmetsp:Transcript_18238/g.33524  ORF Transcript_18238/g.33524 Transcript_18238/m.33524 type:complete len:225 (-) Transcript_18238:27-701(-)